MRKYLIVGGDQRMAALARLMEGKCDLQTAYIDTKQHPSLTDPEEVLEAAADAHGIILPVPATRDGRSVWTPLSGASMEMGALLEALRSDQFLFAGITPQIGELKTAAQTVNFLQQTSYAYANARLTAEATAALLPTVYGFSPFNRAVLICGFGKIAKLLARLLASANARIGIAARKPADLEMAGALGYCGHCIYELSETIEAYDCVINTIPTCVIPAEALARCRTDALLIDIASKPYGFDFDAAQALGKKVFLEQGLPGRYMPEAEAKALYAVISSSELEGSEWI